MINNGMKKGEGELAGYVKAGMSLEEVARLKECFDIFDSDRSGSISPQELRDAIVALGMEQQAQKILGMVQAYTMDCSEGIDFDAFMELFGFNSDLKDNRSQEGIFAQFDSIGKGYVTAEDFIRVCQLCGQRYSQKELRQMVEHADKDKDGRLSYQEFVSILDRDYPTL